MSALCSFKRRRFFCFSVREPSETAERDVLNEAPTADERPPESAPGRGLPRGAVLHTSLGDIKLKLFPAECPRTVENFTVRAVTHGLTD